MEVKGLNRRKPCLLWYLTIILLIFASLGGYAFQRKWFGFQGKSYASYESAVHRTGIGDELPGTLAGGRHALKENGIGPSCDLHASGVQSGALELNQVLYLPIVMAVRETRATRAIWVQGRAVSSRAEADQMLDRVVQGGFNTVLLWVGYGKVIYHSDILDTYYPGSYDPLAYVIEQAHARELQVQAWWQPGRVMDYIPFRNSHPDWDIAAIDGIPNDIHWLNFSLPEVKQFVGDVVLEIVQKYDVDGVHLDVVRFLGPTSALDCRDFFGPDEVPNTVQSVYQRLQAVAPNVQLTAAVISTKLGSSHLQHWDAWLAGGYIDYVMPMAYLSPSDNDKLEELVREWRNLSRFEAVVPGLSVVIDVADGGIPKTPGQLIAQLEICRLGGLAGFSIFDEGKITNELVNALALYP